MLPSLEITNFRTFSHLAIKRLGRVNLIVGKNNVGKTTLLEALRLYGSVFPHEPIGEILQDRDEKGPATGVGNQIAFGGRVIQSLIAENGLPAVFSLFHGRDPQVGDSVVVCSEAGDKDLDRFFAILEHESTADEDTREAEEGDIGRTQSGNPSLEVRVGTRNAVFISRASAVAIHPARGGMILNNGLAAPIYLRDCGLDEEVVARWWDDLSLTEAEERIVDAMRLFLPIRRVTLVAHPYIKGRRIPKVLLTDTKQPVPLAALGDGVVHMFHLAVALEYAGKEYSKSTTRENPVGRFFLVDEVESGIHYSMHADMWRHIFRFARMHDIQVFATTHSLDCLNGFAEAVAEDEENDGVVVRLEKKEGQEETRAVIIGRDELPVVTRSRIEVR